ncbi:YciI family protein [Rhodanobacter koreensis]
MTDTTSLSEYLVISRGQWDKDRSPEEIQEAIDDFYTWHDRLVSEGMLKAGQRLAREAKIVSRRGVIDGPFTEAKEVVGGYWFFLAGSLAEAAALAAQNPCLACGLTYEVRPIEEERASAYKLSNEMPEHFGDGE